MFARVASFEGGDTEKLREMNQQIGRPGDQVVFDDRT